MDYPGAEFSELETIEHFDSMASAIKVAKTRKVRSSLFRKEWSGAGSWSEVDKLQSEGWQDGAAQLKPTFDQVEAMIVPTEGQTLGMDYAGFLPCVPSYLAGEPMHMRNHVPAESSAAPIRVMVDIGVSMGVEQDYIMKRSAAIGCFVLLMSLYRPVELSVCSMMQDPHDRQNGYYIPVIRVGSSPFDLPSLAWNMVHTAAVRVVMFHLVNSFKSSIAWAKPDGRDSYDMSDKDYQTAFRKILSLEGDDILIRGIRLSDSKEYSDPVAWAKKQAAECGIYLD